VELLARANATGDSPPPGEGDNRDLANHLIGESVWDSSDLFGDNITKKKENKLRIGYQNIGGLSFNSESVKDDIIRQGINTFEFDIFGMSETNIEWRLIPEHHKLYFRTKYWWESSHVSHASNVTLAPVTRKQFGGVALFRVGPSKHRVAGKGIDKSLLGRWCWTLYREKKIIK
jgi:hypothetical protein